MTEKKETEIFPKIPISFSNCKLQLEVVADDCNDVMEKRFIAKFREARKAGARVVAIVPFDPSSGRCIVSLLSGLLRMSSLRQSSSTKQCPWPDDTGSRYVLLNYSTLESFCRTLWSWR